MYLVSPGWADPQDCVNDTQVCCRQDPTFDADFVVEIADDFGILSNLHILTWYLQKSGAFNIRMSHGLSM